MIHKLTTAVMLVWIIGWSRAAFASDYSGMFTVLGAVTGLVFLSVVVPVFFVTHFLSKRLRSVFRVVSVVYALLLTVFWATESGVIPDDERAALVFVGVPTIIAVCFSVFERFRKQEDANAEK